MATNINSSALDFNQIKEKLKTHLARKEEFADYDFEASGISNILDVLSYNTHLNGLIANFAINESFLNTAQLRSSVVSHSETLGYRPRSKTPSSAIIGIYVDLSSLSPRPSVIEIPSGRSFVGTSDSGAYTFRTRVDYFASDDGNGIYTFEDADGSSDIVVYQGEEKKRTFLVDYATDGQVYVIPDETLDTSQVVVDLYESTTTELYERFTPISQAIEITSESAYFDIKESPNGYYEINFGNGISFGKRPEVGNRVEVKYNSTAGESGNGTNAFRASSDLNVSGTNYAILIDTQTVSAGGSEKESIESIRSLAPVQYAAQQRLVTVSDYKGMILSNFPQVEDVSVWGGEDHFPRDYGSVYISLKFKSGVSESVQELTKTQIESGFSDRLSIMSITNKYIEPEEAFLEIDCSFYYNPSDTTKSISSMQNDVRSYIQSYFTENLGKFEKSFKRSDVLSGIDSVNRSIISSKMAVNIQKRFRPAAGFDRYYEISFPIALAAPDKDEYRIISSKFRIDNVECRLRNKLGTNVIEIISDEKVVVTNAGYYDPKNGTVVLESFKPQSVSGGTRDISISARPVDQSNIKPLRNYLIELDTGKFTVSSIIDDEKTKIIL